MKHKVRFEFTKTIVIDAEVSAEEMKSIENDKGIPQRIWDEAEEEDNEKPIEFERYDKLGWS